MSTQKQNFAELPVVRTATIIATSMALIVVQLDVTIANVAIARIGADLRVSLAGLQWIIDAYTLTFGALLMSGGSLGDRIGSRRIFVAGFVVFGVASLAASLAKGAFLLIAARAAQGIGGALLMPSSLALLNHACAGNHSARARALGLWSAAGNAAGAAGPVVGGFLVSTFGWPSIFLCNIPICAVGIWLTCKYVDETDIASRRGGFDLIGQVLGIVALLTLVGGVIEFGALGWSHPIVWGSLIFACVTGLAFLFVEATSSEPMLPLHFFRNRTFSGSNIAGFVNNLTYYGLVFVLGLYFQTVRGYSPITTGFAFIPLTALVTIANLIGSRLVARLGVRPPMVGGFLVAGIGYLLLSRISDHSSYMALIPGLALISIGLGFSFPAMISALLSTVDRSHSGVASGVLNTVRQAGSAIGVAVFGVIIGSDIGAEITGMRTVLIACAGLAAASAITCLTIRHTPHYLNVTPSAIE